MESNYLVQVLGGSAVSAVHAQFDICPESPSGQSVTYFAFDGGLPGPGCVMISRRDGGDPRLLGRVPSGTGNEGAMQMWLGEEAVAYHTVSDGQPCTVVAPVDGREPATLPGLLCSYAPRNGMGLAPADAPGAAITLLDVGTGEAQPIITPETVLAAHPSRRKLSRKSALEPAAFSLLKPQWASDGASLFFVLTNAPRGPQPKGQPLIRSLFLAEADGKGLRYLGEVGRNPVWGPQDRYVYSLDRWPDGSHTVFAHPVDGNDPYPLVPRVLGTHASLSPDSKHIVIDVFDRPEWGQASIWLYHVPDGEQRILAEFSAPDLSYATGVHPRPAWSRDGQRIYFAAAEENAPQLYALSLQ